MSKRSSSFWSAIILGVLGSFLILPALALAQLEPVLPSTREVFQGSPGLFQRFGSVPLIISTIFNFIIVVAGTIFIILILVGGMQYLTSAGNEEGTGKAKKLMVDAIIGLILTLAAWAIGTFILRQLGLLGGIGQILPPGTNFPGPNRP